MVTGNLTLHPSGIVDPFVGGVEGRCYLWHFHSGCCKYAFLAVSGHWSFCSLILEVSQWPDKDIFKCLAPKIRLFFFFLPHRAASGILVPQPGIKSVPPAVKEWNFSHWTAREVPGGIFFFFFWSSEIFQWMPSVILLPLRGLKPRQLSVSVPRAPPDQPECTTPNF